jgi:hypothetical protein
MQKLIEYLNLKNIKIYERHKKTQNGDPSIIYQLQFSVKDSIKFSEYIYKNATIYLSRKYNIFNNYLQERRSTTIIDNPERVKG